MLTSRTAVYTHWIEPLERDTLYTSADLYGSYVRLHSLRYLKLHTDIMHPVMVAHPSDGHNLGTCFMCLREDVHCVSSRHRNAIDPHSVYI
jgi:hypothetical protein